MKELYTLLFLALLQKHGYKARINIEEAKELNKLNQ